MSDLQGILRGIWILFVVAFTTIMSIGILIFFARLLWHAAIVLTSW